MSSPPERSGSPSTWYGQIHNPLAFEHPAIAPDGTGRQRRQGLPAHPELTLRAGRGGGRLRREAIAAACPLSLAMGRPGGGAPLFFNSQGAAVIYTRCWQTASAPQHAHPALRRGRCGSDWLAMVGLQALEE